jgi:hypothetical protein
MLPQCFVCTSNYNAGDQRRRQCVAALALSTEPGIAYTRETYALMRAHELIAQLHRVLNRCHVGVVIFLATGDPFAQVSVLPFVQQFFWKDKLHWLFLCA